MTVWPLPDILSLNYFIQTDLNMPTHFHGPIRETRALNTFIPLMRAAETLTARLNLGLAEFGLTETQFGVLEALYHLGPLCQKALAGKLLKSSGNITLVIDNLERQGLVVRQRDAQDRRFITIHLTEAGQARIAEVFPAHVSRIVQMFDVLTAEEQETLRVLCRKLGRQDSRR